MPTPDSPAPTPARPARTCQKCGRRREDVRYDRFTRRDLCNPCWFSTDPERCQDDR